MNSSKRLIINADDYGACPEVNAAIEQLALAGRLGGVSVLANGACWMPAVGFLHDHSEISAGIHLNAVEGRPVSTAAEVRLLTNAAGSFLAFGALLKRWLLRPPAVSQAIEIEWRAQIERLLRARVNLTHADSHQHLHAFPPAYRCAVKLCQEYRIPALRLPREDQHKPRRRASSFALRSSLAASRAVAPRAALRHNDHFLGFGRVGAYGLAELLGDVQMLPPGLTEMALHPSIKDGVPYHHLSGDRERRALLDDSLPGQIQRFGIELTTWAQVAP